jgi:hypothetical protein
MSPLMLSKSRSEAMLRATSNDMTIVSFVVSIRQLSVPGLSPSCQSGNEDEDIPLSSDDYSSSRHSKREDR